MGILRKGVATAASNDTSFILLRPIIYDTTRSDYKLL